MEIVHWTTERKILTESRMIMQGFYQIIAEKIHIEILALSQVIPI